MHLVQDLTLTHTALFALTDSAMHSNSTCIFKAKIPRPPLFTRATLERVYASFHCRSVCRSLRSINGQYADRFLPLPASMQNASFHCRPVCRSLPSIAGQYADRFLPLPASMQIATFHCRPVCRSLSSLSCVSFHLEIFSMLSVYSALGFIVVPKICNKLFWGIRRKWYLTV